MPWACSTRKSQDFHTDKSFFLCHCSCLPQASLPMSLAHPRTRPRTRHHGECCWSPRQKERHSGTLGMAPTRKGPPLAPSAHFHPLKQVLRSHLGSGVRTGPHAGAQKEEIGNICEFCLQLPLPATGTPTQWSNMLICQGVKNSPHVLVFEPCPRAFCLSFPFVFSIWSFV